MDHGGLRGGLCGRGGGCGWAFPGGGVGCAQLGWLDRVQQGRCSLNSPQGFLLDPLWPLCSLQNRNSETSVG